MVNDLAPVSCRCLQKVSEKNVATVLNTVFEENLISSKVVKSCIVDTACVLRVERRLGVHALKPKINEPEMIVKNMENALHLMNEKFEEMESALNKHFYKKPRRANYQPMHTDSTPRKNAVRCAQCKLGSFFYHGKQKKIIPSLQ